MTSTCRLEVVSSNDDVPHRPTSAVAEPEIVEEEAEPVAHVDPADIRDDSSDSGSTIFFTPMESFNESRGVEELSTVARWRDEVTSRAFAVSFVLTLLFTFVAINVNLTTGLVPTFTLPVASLGYCMVRIWIFVLTKLGFESRPFTRQENTIILTCFSAAYEIAFSGGVGSYLLAMTRAVSQHAGEDKSARTLELSKSWIIPFLLCVSYSGCFIAVILRKLMIRDLKLSYPSGTAAGELINKFHTCNDSELRRRQSWVLIGSSGISLLWGCFKWFFSGGKGCGFVNFPTFGLSAYKQRLYFSSSSTYVGMGIISAYKVTFSLYIGAFFSSAVLWPMIKSRKGYWYDAHLEESSFRGLQGYKVAIPIGIIMGDSIYKFVRIIYHMFKGQYDKCGSCSNLLPSRANLPASYDDERRTQKFARDPISTWKAVLVYIFFLVISLALLPLIYPYYTWYHVLICYLIAVPLAFCNAYGSGVTDWSLAVTYGKFMIFVMASWAGLKKEGVIIGLVSCGIVSNIVSSAAAISQNMKTGYLALASPVTILVSQIVGVTMGCLVTPLVFFVFSWASPDIGGSKSEYPAPNALGYRLIGIIGGEGLKSLPKHCLMLCLASFLGALTLDIVIDVGERHQRSWAKFIPLPLALAVSFHVGGSFALDMCVGAIILYLWGRIARSHSDRYARVFASALILGEGIWTMVSSVLSIFRMKPQMCLKVLPRQY